MTKTSTKKLVKKRQIPGERGGVDTVRASRDGHQFHEAWLARRALGLLLARDELCGIAVEGLSKDIEEGANADTTDIADAVFFYGSQPNFEKAKRIDITQFKYSVSRADTGMRFSDIKKTIEKFSSAEAGFEKKYGAERTREKFRYTLFTNRPIATDLTDAIVAAGAGREPEAKAVKKQYDQLLEAVTLKGEALIAFLSRFELVGRAEDLGAVQRHTATIIADWSASGDLLARARIGELKDVIRKKAGTAGQGNNIIGKVDVLAALGLSDEDELLPTPEAFPKVGDVVERVQLGSFIGKVGSAGRWLIHAEGGIGKTVFAQSLVNRLGATDEVVLFDCFGGGAYRSFIDGRHRPERGLMHIVNELACRGLCDPILPGSSEPSEVIRRAIERFTQTLTTLRRTRPSARLIIIMDAADNAADEAQRRNQPSFPKELLESLSHLPSVDGLIVIATARPERRDLAIGTAQCQEYKIDPFALDETSAFVLARRKDATAAQLVALRSRSDGNPRVLANLIEPDRSLSGETLTTEKVHLDALIEDRIERAINLADAKGAKAGAIDAFLCALGVLPPPVPVDEMALAFGLSKDEAASLAADLSPLLERTRHGLIFRDEPTETLVKRKYSSKLSLMNDVVVRLGDAQGTSVYAARSLPLLLSAMNRVGDLRRLAFDTRFPPELDSDVAKRAIRLVRVKTALGAAAQARDYDATTDLLVELSSLALVNERGDAYLAENPDLVVGLADPECLRRLFEMRLGWPGQRHARLTIAYTTDKDLGAAYGHAVAADEWIRWSYEQEDGSLPAHRADVSEHVAIPFYLAVDGRQTNAAGYIGSFNADFGYKIAEKLFSLLSISHALGTFPALPTYLGQLARCPKASPALIGAALTCFPGTSDEDAKRLLQRLAVSQKKPTDSDNYLPRKEDSFRASLLRCALRACRLGLAVETEQLLERASTRRYDIWSLSDPWSTSYVLPWILVAAVNAALAGRPLSLFDCLPAELWRLVEGEAVPEDLAAQQKLLSDKLAADPPYDTKKAKEEEGAKESKSRLSSSERHHASDKIRQRVVPALDLGQVVVQLLRARTPEDRKTATVTFFKTWAAAQDASKEDAWRRQEAARYIDELYSACALQLFETILPIDPKAADRLETCLGRCAFVPAYLWIDFITLFSRVPECHSHAGRAAVAAIKVIELEDDVQQRADLFARLARAILPANRTEAGFLFKRGLTELDAIGSGDHDFINELLAFAASLRGDPVNPAIALRLAKICELNNYDSDKFPWPLTAKAFSRIWGTKYLAQIARWHDRDKVDLEYTLPAAVSFLVRDGRLAPIDGTLLLELVEPITMWDWGWRDLFDAVLERTSDVAVFHELLNQFERMYPTRRDPRYLAEIRAVLERKADILAALAPRLDALQRSASAHRQVDRNRTSSSSEMPGPADNIRREQEEQNRVEINAAITATDPLDSASLETLVEQMDAFDGALIEKLSAFDRLRSQVAYADRDRHIVAIANTRNLDLFAKNELLKATKEAWLSDSPSALAGVGNLAKRLVSAHADELMSAEWGFNWELNKLAELTGAPRIELAIDLVAEATSRGLRAAATTWLNLASLVSASAAPSVPKLAFERMLDDAAGRLADDVGDGPWRAGLDPGDDPDATVAGLIWFCLGSPEAKSRWRAAHVVRSCARLGRWPVIAKLFDMLGAHDAGAFRDQKLPFFVLHAKFWFLLAVARIALDFPNEIAAYAARLEAIALDDAFPHVGLRDVAVRTLKICLGKSRSAAAKDTLKKIAAVHKSKFPKAKKSSYVATRMWDRPNDVPKPEPDFNFEYDFEKYKITDLGRMFGVPQWEAGDRCIRWIRTMSPDSSSMYDFAGRSKPSRGSDGYREGTDDRFHSYGTYLAWHARALAGGELFLERPVVRLERYEESWEDWLKDYRVTRPDGLWLSDGVGPYPARACDDLSDGTSKQSRPTSDQGTLLNLAGIEIGKPLGQSVLVAGSWSSPDNVSVNIMSALVPKGEAELAAVALGAASEHNLYLPSLRAYEGEDEDGDFGNDENTPCKVWISRREAYSKLDKYDPYGSDAAIQRPRLTMAINTDFAAASKDPWSADWLMPGGKRAYSADAWGMRRGDGQAEKAEEGTAVVCDTAFLLEVLRSLDCSLLLLVKLDLYIEGNRYGDDETSSSKFVHSWLTATIDDTGAVQIVEPVDPDREVVRKLGNSGYDLKTRFDALAQDHAKSADKKV